MRTVARWRLAFQWNSPYPRYSIRRSRRCIPPWLQCSRRQEADSLPPSSPVILPLRITPMTPPGRALHGHRHAKECAHVGNGAVQLLEIHIQRLALGTARLLVEPHALHVEAFENRLVEKLARVLHIRGAHFEFDPADEVRNEPVEADEVFVCQKAFDA